MGTDDSWVQAYRQEHECDEHWELRRSFLLAHRDRFPEDRLVCLAQVFTNVEFLGCRYPEKTMKLIAELSQEVAAGYREKQKTRLQRTFVQASDAAGAKVKGLKRPQDQTPEQPSFSLVSNAAPKKDNSNSSSVSKSDCTPAKNRKFTNFVPASSEPAEEESSDCQIILETSSSKQASSELCKIKPSENTQQNTSKGVFASSQNESLDSKVPKSIKMTNFVSGSTDSSSAVPKKESPDGGTVKNSNFPQNLQASSSAKFQDVKPNPAKFPFKSFPFSTGSSSQAQDNNSIPPLASLFERRGQNNTNSAQPSTSVSERTFTTPSGDVKPLSFSHYGGVRTYHIDRPTNNANDADDDVVEVDPDEEDPDNLLPNNADVAAAFNAINSSPFGRLVLIEMTEQNDGPAQIIHRSAFGCQIPTNYLYERLPGGKTCCKLYINRNIVAQGIEHNNKSAKESACAKALLKLQEHCFTLKIKAKILTDGTTIGKGEDPTASTENQTIGEENIGNKLLRLMGWSGGGLGKDNQGIEEPVSVSQRVNRSGLGIQQSKGNDTRAFAIKMTRILKDFADQNSDRDLVFSSDFTKPERKKMHEIAQKFHLKTKSYGKDNERYLVVSHKFSVMRIVEKMLHCGGSSEKYELIPPTSLKLFKDR